ncbi:MAG: hypothetical protein JWR74_1843 [Polaromonas sp.]|nr:hypothetical protein [Polaromonas sp.]
MNTTTTMKSIALTAMTACANSVFAHDGHAMQGTHWHATDAWGFAIMGVAAAAAIWLSRGGK